MGKWIGYLIFLIVIGVGVASDSHDIDAAYNAIIWTFLIALSVYFLWKMWRAKDRRMLDSSYGAYGLLPKRWRDWIFGESDKSKD